VQTNESIAISPAKQFRLFVEEHSGQQILSCYQCGKCTAGCPLAYAMDIGPRQVMRAIQLGLRDELLHCNTIWLCVFCQTCSARCPRQIDIAKVMESIRLLAIKEKVRPADKDIAIFHRIFFSLIPRLGRVHEIALGGAYNLISRHPLTNTKLLPEMIIKGKLLSLPTPSKGTSEVKSMFTKAKKATREREDDVTI